MTNKTPQTKEQIIDFEKKGNIVRFYFGINGKQWGDDWNDTPYEHNAGQVYDEYVTNRKDISFDFDDLVLEPCDGEMNSRWCKEDMIERRVPCLIVVPKKLSEQNWSTDFAYWVSVDGIKKYFFGDII